MLVKRLVQWLGPVRTGARTNGVFVINCNQNNNQGILFVYNTRP
jgi:hypothetical protein